MLDSLQVTDDLMRLQITWSDGSKSELAAQVLRQEARDAHSIRFRIDHGDLVAAEDLKITALAQVGAAAVNVHFSDGHDRAIYPFVYLKELSERFDN
ncbi:MAG: DUF971 domain-containing protein [Pseudomonadota bacterium]